MIRVKEMSSWTTSCTVGCSRTCFPQKIGKRNISVGVFGKNSSESRSRKNKKQQKNHISHKIQGKRKQCSRILVVVFWRVLGCYFFPKHGCTLFRQETIKLSDLGLAVKLGKRGYVKGDELSIIPCHAPKNAGDLYALNRGGNPKRLLYQCEAFRAQHHTCLQRCWQEALARNLISTLISFGGWLARVFAENLYILFILCFHLLGADSIRLDHHFSTGWLQAPARDDVGTRKKASDSTTMPWRWSKFRPNFFWYKKMRWRTQGQTNIHFMTDSGLMWPPPSSFQTRQINNILTTPGTTRGVFFSGLGAVYVSIFQTCVGKCEPGKRYNTQTDVWSFASTVSLG